MAYEINKDELLSWLAQEANPIYLNKVQQIKEEAEANQMNQPFDFDKAFAEGYTVEAFREEMHRRIKSYPWKK